MIGGGCSVRVAAAAAAAAAAARVASDDDASRTDVFKLQPIASDQRHTSGRRQLKQKTVQKQ